MITDAPPTHPHPHPHPHPTPTPTPTSVKPAKMPHKRDTTRNSQSDSASITNPTVNNLRRSISDEVRATIKDAMDTLSSRLGT